MAANTSDGMARLLAKSCLLASCLLAASIFLLPPARTAEEKSRHHDSLQTWIGHKSPKGLPLRNMLMIFTDMKQWESTRIAI